MIRSNYWATRSSCVKRRAGRFPLSTRDLRQPPEFSALLLTLSQGCLARAVSPSSLALRSWHRCGRVSDLGAPWTRHSRISGTTCVRTTSALYVRTPECHASTTLTASRLQREKDVVGHGHGRVASSSISGGNFVAILQLQEVPSEMMITVVDNVQGEFWKHTQCLTYTHASVHRYAGKKL